MFFFQQELVELKMSFCYYRYQQLEKKLAIFLVECGTNYSKRCECEVGAVNSLSGLAVPGALKSALKL